MKRKIIFAGSGFFAVPQIEALAKVYDLEIITQKSSNPVKIRATKLKLPIHEISNLSGLEKVLAELKPSVLIVSDFGIILSEKALKIPKLVLNTHPSLLPKYRGPSPYVSAILNGEKETGVSLIKMTRKIDAGPIYTWIELRIAKNETSTFLRKRLGELAGKILVIKLEKVIAGRLEPVPQDESKATYTKQFKKEDGQINWREPAELIERKIRAFTPWPGTFTFFELKNGKKIRVKISEAEVEKGNNLKPGKIKQENNELKIKAGKNYLIVKRLQPEGKKFIAATEFLKGYYAKLKNNIL